MTEGRTTGPALKPSPRREPVRFRDAAPIGSRRVPRDRDRSRGRRLESRGQHLGGTRRLRRGRRHGARRGATLRPGNRSRRDGLVLVARARRPQRGRPTGDRRPVLLYVRLRREGPPPRQGDGDEGPRLRPWRGGGSRRRQIIGNTGSTSDALAIEYFNKVHTRAGLPAYEVGGPNGSGPLTLDNLFPNDLKSLPWKVCPGMIWSAFITGILQKHFQF